MNQFMVYGQPAPAASYVACWHTTAQTHLTGFDTLAEARQYVARQETSWAPARQTTLAIVQTRNDELVYYRRSSGPQPRWFTRFLNFFL